ncbi:unnamed protein product [Chrysoparadoxa australica]
MFGEKAHTLRHGRPVRFIYISPHGDYCITFSDIDAVIWVTPEDKENDPSRFTLDPMGGRVSVSAQGLTLNDACEETPNSVFPYPDFLHQGLHYDDRPILAVACNNQSDGSYVSVLVSHKTDLHMYNLSPKLGWRSQSSRSASTSGSVTAQLAKGMDSALLPARSWDNEELGGRVTMAKWLPRKAEGDARGVIPMVPQVLLLGNQKHFVVMEVPNKALKIQCPHTTLRIKPGGACLLPHVMPVSTKKQVFGALTAQNGGEEEDVETKSEGAASDKSGEGMLAVKAEDVMKEGLADLWEGAPPGVVMMQLTDQRVISVSTCTVMEEAKAKPKSLYHAGQSSPQGSPTRVRQYHMQSYRLPDLTGRALSGASNREVLARIEPDSRLRLHVGNPWLSPAFRASASEILAMERSEELHLFGRDPKEFSYLSGRRWFTNTMSWFRSRKSESNSVTEVTGMIMTIGKLKRARGRAQERIKRRKLAQGQFVARVLALAEERVAKEVWLELQLETLTEELCWEVGREALAQTMRARMSARTIQRWWRSFSDVSVLLWDNTRVVLLGDQEEPPTQAAAEEAAAAGPDVEQGAAASLPPEAATAAVNEAATATATEAAAAGAEGSDVGELPGHEPVQAAEESEEKEEG